MEEFVEYIAKSLVDNPDKVMVSSSEDATALVIKLSVDASDIGKVIGKQGKIASAIRTVTRAIARKDNKRIVIKIEDGKN